MRTPEQVVLDTIKNINDAGLDKATWEQISRWYEESKCLSCVLGELLAQGRVTYSQGAYYVCGEHGSGEATQPLQGMD